MRSQNDKDQRWDAWLHWKFDWHYIGLHTYIDVWSRTHGCDIWRGKEPLAITRRSGDINGSDHINVSTTETEMGGDINGSIYFITGKRRQS